MKSFTVMGLVWINLPNAPMSFFVHRAAAIEASEVLGEMMKDEGKFTFAIDYDPKDFSGVLKYMYTGEYDVPDIDKEMRVLEVDRSDDAPFYFFSEAFSTMDNDLDRTDFSKMVQGFVDTYIHPERQPYPRVDPFLQNADMTETLLRHADMYLAGKHFRIHGLSSLAMNWLAHTLLHFKDTYHSVLCIKTLVNHVFSKAPVGDAIREMLAFYMACRHFKYRWHPLMGDEGFPYPLRKSRWEIVGRYMDPTDLGMVKCDVESD